MMATPHTVHLQTAASRVHDLPADILVHIFEYLQYEAVDNYGQLIWRAPYQEHSAYRQTLQNVRLTCRLFNQFASMHLFSVTRIRLERSSLDYVEMMLKSPSILGGIQVIQVGLQYRPRDLAQSLALFREHRLSELDAMANDCSYNEETWFLGGYDDDDETICDLPRKVYQEAITKFHVICKAWDKETGYNNYEIDNETIEGYRSVLHEGYAKYCDAHEEQSRLIADGSFVKAIAKLISQLPRHCYLEFTDQPANDIRLRDPTEILLDSKKLSQLMETPQQWRIIEEIGTDSDLAPRKLLSALPVAIHRQGTGLRGILNNCFPLKGGRYDICGQPHEPLWNDFNVSCNQLKIVSWGSGGSLGSNEIRRHHPGNEDKVCLDKYFGAILSSAYLEYIYLRFHSFRLKTWHGHNDLEGKAIGVDMGAALSMTQYPQLKIVEISSISIRQSELEFFCNGLTEKLEDFCIFDIELIEGVWAGTLDILRTKYATLSSEGRCKINFKSLYGAEFGDRGGVIEPWSSWTFSEDWLKERRIIVQSRKYVNGDPQVMENPLKSR